MTAATPAPPTCLRLPPCHPLTQQQRRPPGRPPCRWCLLKPRWCAPPWRGQGPPRHRRVHRPAASRLPAGPPRQPPCRPQRRPRAAARSRARRAAAAPLRASARLTHTLGSANRPHPPAPRRVAASGTPCGCRAGRSHTGASCPRLQCCRKPVTFRRRRAFAAPGRPNRRTAAIIAADTCTDARALAYGRTWHAMSSRSVVGGGTACSSAAMRSTSATVRPSAAAAAS